KRIFSQVEDLLPVISFGTKKDGETEKKHDDFVVRMVQHGYTERQVRRLVEWYMRVKQAGRGGCNRGEVHYRSAAGSARQETGERQAFPASRQGAVSGCRQEDLRGPRHQGCPGARVLALAPNDRKPEPELASTLDYDWLAVPARRATTRQLLVQARARA